MMPELAHYMGNRLPARNAIRPTVPALLLPSSRDYCGSKLIIRHFCDSLAAIVLLKMWDNHLGEALQANRKGAQQAVCSHVQLVEIVSCLCEVILDANCKVRSGHEPA
jgi:hypothetical protein